MLENERVWAEINLDNIGNNIKIIKSLLKEKTEIMAVVKADGYGHGAIDVSKVALKNGATCFAVSCYREAIILRESGIDVPILILGYTPKTLFYNIIKNKLTQTIFDKETAKELSNQAKKINEIVDINIKIDTGMNRLGFYPSLDSLNEILEISKMPNINITGVFTHLATSDSLDHEFTNYQINKFYKFVEDLRNNNLKDFKVHISNSGAILNHNNINADIVRPGIIMYGLSPSKDLDIEKLGLLPALSLKTRISYLKYVPENESIGYGRTFFTKRRTKVATLPIGYADGYSRVLSNKGRVLINGLYAPIIGNICMDQMMVDVTDIENVKLDQEVILIGKDNNNKIAVEEIADIEQTINYEIVCNIGKRVPRVYIKDNEVFKISIL